MNYMKAAQIELLIVALIALAVPVFLSCLLDISMKIYKWLTNKN
jgi:hypothetical protein